MVVLLIIKLYNMRDGVLFCLAIIFLFFAGTFTAVVLSKPISGELFIGTAIIICLCLIGFTPTVGFINNKNDEY